MKKIFAKLSAALFALVLIAFVLPASAGAPAGTTGAPPTTMIGPLVATKTELFDSSGFGYAISSIMAFNASAAAAFIQWFDRPCADVTVGTTRPSWVTPVLANNWTPQSFPVPLGFATPICVVSTTTPIGAVGSAVNSVFMQVFIP